MLPGGTWRDCRVAQVIKKPILNDLIKKCILYELAITINLGAIAIKSALKLVSNEQRR